MVKAPRAMRMSDKALELVDEKGTMVVVEKRSIVVLLVVVEEEELEVEFAGLGVSGALINGCDVVVGDVVAIACLGVGSGVSLAVGVGIRTGVGLGDGCVNSKVVLYSSVCIQLETQIAFETH